MPKHFMTVNYRAATGVPASFEGFRSEVGRQGFPHAADVYAAMRKEKSDFKLEETAVNSWGHELMADSHFAEAIDLFKFNVQIYPESGDAFDNLGEAYMESGQTQLAVESYKKSLEKSPMNENAKEKLKELEAKVPAAAK